jgi:enoyl-CoA hydratase/carnithine racemase
MNPIRTLPHDKIEIEHNGPIVRVWLNRPNVLNALDTDVLEGIADVFTDLNRAFGVRCVILGGRGRAFSAGADRKASPGADRMSAASGASDRERRWASQVGLRACAAIAECEVATIARVQGWCVGGGLGLAVSCSFRIASSDAMFSIPEVDLGIPLSWGCTPRLIDEIGAAKARELIMMCDPINAVEAEGLHVVHRVVAVEELDTTVDAWAQRIASKPEIAVHGTVTQFRSYAHRESMGNVTETDGDVLMGASRTAAAKAAFGGFAES